MISLEKAEARRRLIRAQLAAPGLPPYRFIDAVDVREFSEEQLAKVYDDALSPYRASGSLTRSEIGCAHSHLTAYRHMGHQGISAAVVLEDDAILSHQFTSVIERVMALVDLQGPQVILLSHVSRYSAWRAKKVDRIHSLCRPYEAYGAHGYFITGAGASAMLSAFPRVLTVADDWAHFMRQGVLDVRAVVPYLVGTSTFSNHSQMTAPRWTPEPPGAFARWVRKYLWRKLAFQLVIKPVLRLHKQQSTW